MTTYRISTPWYTEIYYNFTQSDYWITFAGRNNSSTNYGRDSSGFYISQSWLGSAWWNFPSEIKSKDIKIIKLHLDNPNWWWGCWLSMSNWNTNACCWAYGSWLIFNIDGTTITQAIPSNCWLIIDFENKVIYIDTSPNNKLMMSDSSITTLKNGITNWTVYLLLLCSWAKTSISEAKFYY